MSRLLASILMGSLLVFGSLHALSTQRSVVAQVTRTKGTVTLQEPQGATRGLWILDLVAEGDRLQVPAGGLAEVVLYENNHRMKVYGPASVSLGASGLRIPEVQKGRVVVTPAPVALRVQGGSLRDLNSDQPGGGFKRAGEGRADPEVLEAFPGISLSRTPTLRWSGPRGAHRFQVVVYRSGEAPGQGGEAPCQGGETSEHHLALEGALERGERYTYQVTARDQDGRVLGKARSLAMALPETRVAELADARQQFEVLRRQDPDDASPYLQMAALYNQEGLLLEAAEVLELLAAALPEAPYPHARTKALYAALGMQVERQRAADLEDSRRIR